MCVPPRYWQVAAPGDDIKGQERRGATLPGPLCSHNLSTTDYFCAHVVLSTDTTGHYTIRFVIDGERIVEVIDRGIGFERSSQRIMVKSADVEKLNFQAR